MDYLRYSRPACIGLREVFIAARAPTRPLTREAISRIVERACDRAGLTRFGAHRLQHTLGERMVTSGVRFDALRQVLRHANAAKTAGYARVDLPMLRSLAQPWPATGGER